MSTRQTVIAEKPAQAQLQRFQDLESDIRHCEACSAAQKKAQQVEQLNEYIDLGLEMANQAGYANRTYLQESWLKRLYNTLFETALDMVQPEYWRALCLDYLYQPLFALQHLYRNHPHKEQQIKKLFHEIHITSRYLY